MKSIEKHLKRTSDAGIQRLDFNDIFNVSLETLRDENTSNIAKKEAEANLKHAEALIRKIHSGIYCTTFPIPSEQESVEDWLDRLKSGDAPQNLQLFTAYGKNLSDLSKVDVAGFIVSEYYKGTETGLINYVIRDKDFSRGNNRFPAEEMCDGHVQLMRDKCHQIDGKELKAVLWEANKTHAMMLGAIEESEMFSGEQKFQYTQLIEISQSKGIPLDEVTLCGERFVDIFENIHSKKFWETTDCMDPGKRISHIQKTFGAKQIGIDYAQAPLSPPESATEAAEATCADLNLYVYKAADFPDVRAQHLRSFITSFSTIFAGKKPQDLGVDALDRLMSQLDYMVKNNVPLLKDQQTPAHTNALKAIQARRSQGQGAPMQRHPSSRISERVKR